MSSITNILLFTIIFLSFLVNLSLHLVIKILLFPIVFLLIVVSVALPLDVKFFLFAIVTPLISLFSPQYLNGLFQFSTFHVLSLVACLLPILYLVLNPVLLNPFFVLPFTCSFLVASWSHTGPAFIKNYILYLGYVITVFGVYRTRPPWRYIELRLYLTKFFTTYFEVRGFWRVVVIIICYVFLPFLWFISVYLG